MAKPQNGRAHTTRTMQRMLFSAPDFETYARDNAPLLTTPRLCYYLCGLCRKLGSTPGQVIRRSGVDRTYGHQIFNGTRKPSRDKLLQLAFGFGLTVDGTQEMLKTAQKSPLYPLLLRDAAVMRCLHDGKTILEAQEMLNRMGLTLLGGEDRYG
jgi:hypothetical protein